MKTHRKNGQFRKGHKVNLGKRNALGTVRVVSYETRLKISLSKRGTRNTEEQKEKIRASLLGRKITWGDKISKAKKGVKNPKIGGANHFNWKGGATPINKAIRSSMEYKEWRESVFRRDNYTCTICGVRGVFLHADHIKPFSLFPEFRLELSNGRTLCVPCHRKTDTFAGRIKNHPTVYA